MEYSRWQFDEEFLTLTIKNLQKMLKRKNLNADLIDMIQFTIYKFSEYLDILNDNDVIENNEITVNEQSFQTLKRKFLNKALSDYNMLGDDIIDAIIYMTTNHVYFGFEDYRCNYKLTPTEIVDKSLSVYEEILPDFLPDAKYIVDNPIKLINFSDRITSVGSECYYEGLLQLPFINVDDYKHLPLNFIHELQHGIEGVKDYKTCYYYKELGSILMEILYIDKMVRNKESLADKLYFDRISYVEAELEYLGSYLKCVKYLKLNNFNVATKDFISLLKKNGLIYDDRNIVGEILPVDFLEMTMYLLSFFKSLEVRNIIYRNDKYGYKVLNNSLNNSYLSNLNAKKMLSDYENYLDEIISKRRNSSHVKMYRK